MKGLTVRFPLHNSLKTSVMAHLAFLILSAMLLMNVVMLKYAENQFIQTELQTGRLLMDALNGFISYEIEIKKKSLEDLEADVEFKDRVSRMFMSRNFKGAMVLNRVGKIVFNTGTWGDAKKGAISLSRECLSTRKSSFDFFGSTWGVFWLAHQGVNLSSPLLMEGRLIGVTTVMADFRPLYIKLRESERVVLIYIILNTFILVLFGVYLLSRTVVKPIHGLLGITEKFKDEGSVPPLSDTSPNEIGRLSRSLNLMLKRLDQNKKELQDNISSLEKANLELKRARDEIVKSEKLASVGRLATGVAHEIGNPIGILLGYLELLKGEHLGSTEQQDFLDRMESEITRINQIIRDLLDFSRTSSGDVKKVNVHELITETLEMLRPQPMMSHMEMTTVFQAFSDMARADSNQLKQVFLNIIMNAADAMAEDRTSVDESSSNILTIETQNRENYLEICFTDTGPGIREEDLVRIFDPFYTTKEPGKGTGLGLTVCYNLIKAMQGEISATSDPETGTRIVVAIPLYQEMPGPEST